MNSIPLVSYSINNMYFMGIQAGIQAAHSIVELASQNAGNTDYKSVGNLDFYKGDLFYKWATDYKTIVILNGGPVSQLESNARIIEDSSFPSARFYETDCSTDCFSSISVICPNAKEVIKRTYLHKFLSYEDRLFFRLLSNLKMAI